MPRNFMSPVIAFPAVNALMCVLLTIFVSKRESLPGEMLARTVWRVFVIARKKQSNMENIVKG